MSRKIKLRILASESNGIVEEGTWCYWDADKNDSCYYLECRKEGTDIQQFTGLFDKNGKEIWEGDIIKITYPFAERSYTNKILYYTSRCSFVVEGLQKTYLDSLHQLCAYCEVIGNIYQNPKLLEQFDGCGKGHTHGYGNDSLNGSGSGFNGGLAYGSGSADAHCCGTGSGSAYGSGDDYNDGRGDYFGDNDGSGFGSEIELKV